MITHKLITCNRIYKYRNVFREKRFSQLPRDENGGRSVSVGLLYVTCFPAKLHQTRRDSSAYRHEHDYEFLTR